MKFNNFNSFYNMGAKKGKITELEKFGYYVIEHEGYYSLYDKRRESKYANIAFVATVKIQGDKVYYKGKGYANVKDLSLQIDTDADNHPYPIEFDDPAYRICYALQMKVNFYIESLGYKKTKDYITPKGGTTVFVMKDIYDRDVSSLSIHIDNDSEMGEIIGGQTMGCFSSVAFNGYDNAKTAINTMIAMEHIALAVNSITAIEKTAGNVNLEGVMQTELDNLGFMKMITPMKEKLIEKLETILKDLKK